MRCEITGSRPRLVWYFKWSHSPLGNEAILPLKYEDSSLEKWWNLGRPGLVSNLSWATGRIGADIAMSFADTKKTPLKSAWQKQNVLFSGEKAFFSRVWGPYWSTTVKIDPYLGLVWTTFRPTLGLFGTFSLPIYPNHIVAVRRCKAEIGRSVLIWGLELRSSSKI